MFRRTLTTEPEDRNVLRKTGINALVEIDGKVHKPAGGITGAGTSIRASMAADQVIRATEKLELTLRNDRGPFERFAQEYGLAWPAEPSFEFGLLEPSGLAFKELSTNLALAVG